MRRTLADLDVETVAYILEISDDDARLMLAARETFEALRAFDSLAADIESIPYPLKVRFREASIAAHGAIAKATGANNA